MSRSGPLRLAIVSSNVPTRRRPDVGVFVTRQARLLTQAGVDVRLIAPRLLLPSALRRYTAWPELSEADVVVPPEISVRNAWYFRPPGGRFTRYEGFAKAGPVAAVTWRWQRERPFDVVLGVDVTADAVAAIAAARAVGVPVANLAIGSDVMLRARQLPGLGSLLSWTLAHTDLPMGVSRATCAALASAGPCQRTPQCVYLGREPAVRLTAMEREGVRKTMGVGADEVLAVFVGRLTDTKGMQELAQAAESLLPRLPRLKLLCIGDGPRLELLQQTAARAGRSGAVLLPGRLAPEEVSRHLCASDFMVFPSHSEGMPQAVLEAMDHALPIVATAVGGIPEAVVAEQTGLLVPPRDAGALAKAMERLATDDGLRAQLGAGSLERARREFDPAQNAQLLADTLRALATARSCASRTA